ncbi:MAG: dTDP-4-dehydrorhamnose 3,5-epimerase [Pseudomonadota bacterium]
MGRFVSGLVDRIAGVSLTPLRQIATPGGDVMHALKAEEPDFHGFGEAYFSAVQAGAIKGWKRHTRMVMNLIVPVGRIGFLIRDERGGSPTMGAAVRAVLSPDAPETYARLTVAPDLWMAFAGQAPGTSLLLNVASLSHDPAEAENRPLEAFDVSALSEWPSGQPSPGAAL